MQVTITKHRMITLLLLIALVGFLFTLSVSTQVVHAQDEAQTACQGIAAAGGDCGGGEDQLANVIRGVIQILLFIVGVAAVIMLIVGGIRYVVSGGDQQAVAAAKNTIVYSIVGIIVAVLAYAAVVWVFGQISGSGGTPSSGTSGPSSTPQIE